MATNWNLQAALITLIALLASLLSGCAASTKGQTEARTPGNFIDDEAIETLVVRQMRKSDEGLKNAHLSVVSYNGIVLLLGQVDNDVLKRKALEAATNIRKVHANLPGSRRREPGDTDLP